MNAGELEQPKKMSKKARKLASRLTVAELKQLVRRPDVVEVEDVTSADPRLLVYLKSYRNTGSCSSSLVFKASLPSRSSRNRKDSFQIAW